MAVDRRRARARLATTILLSLAAIAGCGQDEDLPVLTVDMPLHLEDHLDVAVVEGSEMPVDPTLTIVWHFDEPQSDWQPIVVPLAGPTPLERTTDALRVNLLGRPNGGFRGGIYVELPDWTQNDWSHVIVRTRTSSEVGNFGIGRNRAELGPGEAWVLPMRIIGSSAPVSDGLVHTYQIPLRGAGQGMMPWQRLGLWVVADEPGSIDVLSVTVVSTGGTYDTDKLGMRSISVGGVYRRSLFTHAPGRIQYRVEVPDGARFEAALGVVGTDNPVEFRILVEPEGGDATTLLSEVYGDQDLWAERSVDLSKFAGQTVTLWLEADSDEPGTVALWGTPTLSGVRRPDKPNVILYIFDGGAADYMSVYGYNRRTTPTLERLAAEGALFEHAYSNSSWTLPSTASFMTSLQTSVTGGLPGNGTNQMPGAASTMAEHMHRAGYQTAVFTGNPNAGTLIGLQRGVDVFREDWEDFSYFAGNNHKEASKYLHEGFWSWREAAPHEPFWVHFQTTDTHEDFPAPPPFGGLFVGADELRTWMEVGERLNSFGGPGPYSSAWDSSDVSRTAFYSVHKGLYDEAMAHNDYRLGQLVDRLKARGEWENTLLIIGGDHSIRAAAQDVGVALNDSLPPPWSQPNLRPTVSRVPLIFVWPGHIAGGQRFDQAVSMIDVLPTLLDLVGLPAAEISQGQSLVPLMLGLEGWEPRPVILDEFVRNGADGELSGLIEVVDGRWGASLEINPDPDTPQEEQRPVPLLLYDLWTDPMALLSVHEEHPDLVERYTTFLDGQLAAHQALATQFTPGDEVALTPEQLETLRTLGYIR